MIALLQKRFGSKNASRQIQLKLPEFHKHIDRCLKHASMSIFPLGVLIIKSHDRYFHETPQLKHILQQSLPSPAKHHFKVSHQDPKTLNLYCPNISAIQWEELVFDLYMQFPSATISANHTIYPIAQEALWKKCTANSFALA